MLVLSQFPFFPQYLLFTLQKVILDSLLWHIDLSVDQIYHTLYYEILMFFEFFEIEGYKSQVLVLTWISSVYLLVFSIFFPFDFQLFTFSEQIKVFSI